MVRDVRAPNPPTPGRPRISSSLAAGRATGPTDLATHKRDRLQVPAIKRTPLGERNDNLEGRLPPTAHSKVGMVPHSLSRFVQAAPKARLASHPIKTNRPPHPRVSMPLQINDDDTLLFDIGPPDSLLSETDPSEEESESLTLGRLMTPADSQDTSVSSAKAPKPKRGKPSREGHRTSRLLPTPPSSMANEQSSPPPTPRPVPTQNRTRARPSPTPPRRVSEAPKGMEESIGWDTPLRRSSLPPPTYISPNPRKKKSPRLEESASMQEPIRLKSPFAARDRVEIVITPAAAKGTPKARPPEPIPSVHTPSRRRSSQNRQIPATAPAVARHVHRSSAGTRRRQSTPRTVSSARRGPRMSTGSLTPAARKALKGRRLGITPTMVEATDGDDPLLLKGPDEHLEGIIPGSGASRRLEAALQRAGETMIDITSKTDARTTNDNELPKFLPEQVTENPLDDTSDSERHSSEQPFDETERCDPIEVWASDDDTDVLSDDRIERCQENTIQRPVDRQVALSPVTVQTLSVQERVEDSPIWGLGIAVPHCAELLPTSPRAPTNDETWTRDISSRPSSNSLAWSMRSTSEVEKLKIISAPAEPIPLAVPPMASPKDVLESIARILGTTGKRASSPQLDQTKSSDAVQTLTSASNPHHAEYDDVRETRLDETPVKRTMDPNGTSDRRGLLESFERHQASRPDPDKLIVASTVCESNENASPHRLNSPKWQSPKPIAPSLDLLSTTPPVSAPSNQRVLPRTLALSPSPVVPISRTRAQAPFYLLTESSKAGQISLVCDTPRPLIHTEEDCRIEVDRKVSLTEQLWDSVHVGDADEAANITQEAEEGQWDISIEPTGCDIADDVAIDDLSFEDVDDQADTDNCRVVVSRTNGDGSQPMSTEALPVSTLDTPHVSTSNNTAAAPVMTSEAVELVCAVQAHQPPQLFAQTFNAATHCLTTASPDQPEQTSGTSVVVHSTIQNGPSARSTDAIAEPDEEQGYQLAVEISKHVDSCNEQCTHVVAAAQDSPSLWNQCQPENNGFSIEQSATSDQIERQASLEAVAQDCPPASDLPVVRTIFRHSRTDQQDEDNQEDNGCVGPGHVAEHAPEPSNKIVIKVINRGVVKVERDETVIIHGVADAGKNDEPPHNERGLRSPSALRDEDHRPFASASRTEDSMLRSLPMSLFDDLSASHTDRARVANSVVKGESMPRYQSSRSNNRLSRPSDRTPTSSPRSQETQDVIPSSHRVSLEQEIDDATAIEGKEEPNEYMRSVVEVSSLDPKAAARAAAILKLNHAYIEHGVLSAASGSGNPVTLRRSRSRSRNFEMSSATSFDSGRKLNKDELLHEAELEIVASRGRSTSVLSARANASASSDSDENEILLPGGWKRTPGGKRKRRHRRRPSAVSAITTTKATLADECSAERPWRIIDWKRLEKVFRSEREAWVRQREVKPLPASSGLLGWMLRASGGSKAPLAPVWDNERVVNAFLAAEASRGTVAVGGEWERSMILLRVKALEKRVAHANTSNKPTATCSNKSEAKRQRLERDITPEQAESSVISIVPPSTIRRALNWAWGDVSRREETSPSANLQGQATDGKGKEKETREAEMWQVANQSVTLSANETKKIEPLEPYPACTRSLMAEKSLETPLTAPIYPMLPLVETPTAPLYPPLRPPLSRRSSALQALFDTASHPSKRPEPIAILYDSQRRGKESPSVRDLVKSFEESGILKGIDKGGLARSQSRGSLREDSRGS